MKRVYFRRGIPVEQYYFNQVYHGKTANESEWPSAEVDKQIKACASGTLFGTYGVPETNALKDGLLHAPGLKGGRVLVIGSERPWVEACAIAAGALSVVTLEYGKIVSDHPQITTMIPVEFQKKIF